MRRFVDNLLPVTLCLAILLWSPAALAHPHIIRATDRSEVTRNDFLRDLKSARVIFIGELHDRIGHHKAQLSILRALSKDATPVAIGLEMFRKDGQDALDRWTGGNYPVSDFRRDFDRQWSMWDKYQEIFDYARQERLRMVGLNIPREISSKVARNGFDALPKEQRQALGDVRCVVNPEYSQFIRQALGGHGGHGESYLFFCEAQMLWDTMMARHLVEFLKANPYHRVVVLAGSGHAWKFGIPRQLLEQMEVSYRVVLPEVDGRIERSQVVPEVTDYLWLDEGADSWSF